MGCCSAEPTRSQEQDISESELPTNFSVSTCIRCLSQVNYRQYNGIVQCTPWPDGQISVEKHGWIGPMRWLVWDPDLILVVCVIMRDVEVAAVFVFIGCCLHKN